MQSRVNFPFDEEFHDILVKEMNPSFKYMIMSPSKMYDQSRSNTVAKV